MRLVRQRTRAIGSAVILLLGLVAAFAATPRAEAGGYHGRGYYHGYRGYCAPRPVYHYHYRPSYRYSHYAPRRYYYAPRYTYRTGRHYRKYGYFYPYCR